MLAEFLQFLRDNETTISALAGLITMAAALWGALQFAPALRRLGEQSGEAAGREAAGGMSRRSATWRGLMNLGLSEHSRLEQLVSIRTVNIAFFCLAGISLPWLAYSLSSPDMLLLALINLFVFASTLVGFALQWNGNTTLSRWVLMLVALVYWLGAWLAAGPLAGTEYFLVALVSVPVLIFSRAERLQLALALLLALCCFGVGVILSRSLPPLLPLNTMVLQVGYQVNALLLAAMIFTSVRYYLKFASSSYLLLESHREQNAALVSNLLPERIAARVSAGEGAVVADWHAEATVLFVNIGGFDQLYKRMSAMDLVAKLATLFGNFDHILERNNLDKVKTLGTSYVAALGIGGGPADHSAAAFCARQIRDATETFATAQGLELSFRCGIATGIAVSGVIAGSRPNFDIWGAALEEASVNCEAAQPGQILVNESAYWRMREAITLRALSGHERTYEVAEA